MTDRADLAITTFRKFLALMRFTQQYAREMTDHGISPRDFSVLRFLMEAGPATVGEVQGFIYRSPSTASTLVARLEEAGYVSRTRSSEDNRVVLVALTAAGRDLAEKLPLAGPPLLRRRLAKLPPDQLQLIDGVLTDLLHLMEVPEPE